MRSMIPRSFAIVVQASPFSVCNDLSQRCRSSGLMSAAISFPPAGDEIVADIVLDDGNGVYRLRAYSIFAEIGRQVMFGQSVKPGAADRWASQLTRDRNPRRFTSRHASRVFGKSLTRPMGRVFSTRLP